MGIRTKNINISTIKDGVKTGPANGTGEGTSKGHMGKLPLSSWGGREGMFLKGRNKDEYQGKMDGQQGESDSK
jgi:hypothetical protein